VSVGLYSGVSGLALGTGLYKGVSGLWSGATGLDAGFAGTSPFSGASLYLDFLTPSLDPRVTFTRSSNATLVDSTGKITYAPANLLLQSQTFDNASWGKGNATITANATTAPDGTATADALVENSTNGTHFVQQSVSFISGTAYTFSLYVKAGTRSWVRVFLPSAAFSGGRSSYYNLSGAGSLGSSTGSPNRSITNVGNGWYRITLNTVATTTAGGNLGIVAATADNGDFYAGVDGAEALYLWGAQIELATYQTTAGTYNATTSAAYYGPRFDYDPVTLAPKGLLIEEQRVNLFLQSQTFDNATWTKLGTTVTANTAVAPDGTTTADTLAETAIVNVQAINQAVTVVAGTAYTFSTYVKKGNGATAPDWIQLLSGAGGFGATQYANFNIATGTVGTVVGGTATIQNAGNGWYRISVTSTATLSASSNANIAFTNNSDTSGRFPTYLGSTTSDIFVWGAQFEAGSFATSYIPTVASQVTRSADIATMTGTNFSSWYNQSEGTFLIEALLSPNIDSVSGNYYAAISDGTTSNSTHIVDVNGTVSQVVTGGVTQFNQTVGAEPTGILKAALAYATNNTVSSANGAIGGTDTSVSIPTVNRINIGMNAGLFAILNGHVRSIAYYNTRLSNNQLQGLTA